MAKRSELNSDSVKLAIFPERIKIGLILSGGDAFETQESEDALDTQMTADN